MKQVKPKKNLGQHFLTDLTIARRIADTVDACPGLPVLEVGPGMGVLTHGEATRAEARRDRHRERGVSEGFFFEVRGTRYEVRG